MLNLLCCAILLLVQMSHYSSPNPHESQPASNQVVMVCCNASLLVASLFSSSSCKSETKIWSSIYYVLNWEESLSISTISLTFFFGLSSCAWKYLLIHLVRDEHKVHISKHAYASEQLQFTRPESEMTQLDEYDEQASWINYFRWFFTVIKNRWAVWFVWRDTGLLIPILPPDIFQHFSFCWSRVDLDVDRCIWFQIAADDDTIIYT